MESDKMDEMEVDPFAFSGGQWKAPSCMSCIYSKASMCERFGKQKLSITDFDIYDCPHFYPNEREQMKKALKMLNVEEK